MTEVDKREVGALASAVVEYAEKKGYGLGECGYYFNEWVSDYTDSEDEAYLSALKHEAEEFADVLEEHGYSRQGFGQ